MCKSEYRLTRLMQWDGDVLHVTDTIHDVLREAKQAAEDAMTGEVLSHFECDFADFREYMHDKIKWEQKQWAAMPRWIPVTERLPDYPGRFMCVYEVDEYGEVGHCIDWGRYDPDDGWYVSGVTHWMQLPDLPKEEK